MNITQWCSLDRCKPEYGSRVLIKSGDGKPYIARRVKNKILDCDVFDVSAAPFKDGGIITDATEWMDIP